MNALAEGLKALGATRLAAMGAVSLGMFGLLGLLMLHGGGETMALLYTDLDTRETAQMSDALDRAHIAYQVGHAGNEILVPTDQVARARLLLAKDGLPSGGSIGYEIFDRADGLTASQFQQNINQTRALEGELARTIRTISGIKAARVHLVLPHREPFARDRQDAQASVMLTLSGPARLDREGVQAILSLVAAAVPGLRPEHIAIIDSRGALLARAGEPTGPAATAQNAEELKFTTAQRISRSVEQMLERSVGVGHVRVEATVDLDMAQVRETEEKYDPDGQVVRSTQSVTNNSKSSEANPSVSVQNNLPNADAGAAGGAGTQEQRQEETTNYEIGKTVRTLERDQPQIKRLTLAVLVDGTEARAADGTSTWKERTPDELDRIGKLVRGAVGFDEKRGDTIEVVNMRFPDQEGSTDVEPRGPFGLPLGNLDMMRLAQMLIIGLVGIVGLLLVLRPMVLRLTNASTMPGMLATAGGADIDTLIGDAAGAISIPGAPGTPRLAGPGGSPASAGEDENMVNMNNVEGQLRASAIRRVAELVERHPEESLTIVRAWMQQEAA